MTGSDHLDSTNPLDQQRELMNLLSQKTRHQIIQIVLGHPSHLPSLSEFAYFTTDPMAVISEQLDRLRDEGIVKEYTFEPNRSQGLPWKFYGLTPHGVEVLGQFNYLRGVPLARAIIKKTHITDTIDQHRNAPRPSLPAEVDVALRLNERSD